MNAWPSTLTVAPLREWPGALTPKRREAPFKATLKATLSQLDTELRMITARDVELLIAVQPGQFRLDGRPRVNAQVDHPGVVLSFTTDVGHLSYPCDTFTTWEDNLRAVTLALEALRKVDRYGVTKNGEQYRGFLALEAANGPTTVEAARSFLRNLTGPLSSQWYSDAELIRAAKRAAHPDTGGDADTFQRVLDAERVLRGAA